MEEYFSKAVNYVPFYLDNELLMVGKESLVQLVVKPISVVKC